MLIRHLKREFKAFLTEYTDDSGSSVYGNRIRTLGEINALNSRLMVR